MLLFLNTSPFQWMSCIHPNRPPSADHTHGALSRTRLRSRALLRTTGVGSYVGHCSKTACVRPPSKSASYIGQLLEVVLVASCLLPAPRICLNPCNPLDCLLVDCISGLYIFIGPGLSPGRTMSKGKDPRGISFTFDRLFLTKDRSCFAATAVDFHAVGRNSRQD